MNKIVMNDLKKEEDRKNIFMNPWIIDLCCLILFMCFVITAITSIILIVMRKHNKKKCEISGSIICDKYYSADCLNII